MTASGAARAAGAISADLARGISGVRGGLTGAARGITGMHLVHGAVLLSDVSPTYANFKPTAGALPGGSTLLSLVDGLGGWALILALAGLVIGAALWAIGSHSQNYQQSYVGRRAVLVSGVAALLIGAAPTLISFFFSTGQGIVNPLTH